MSELQVAGVYIAINVLILVWLAVRVVSRRRSGKISIGDGGSDDLAVAIRVHGNATEYIPAMMVGLLTLAFMQSPVWSLHALGITFTLGRVMHAFGMGGGPIIFRQLGMMLTWLAMVIVSLAILYFAFT